MSQPGWFPDPGRTYEYRWWDGHRWTEFVASNGEQSTDGLEPPPLEPQAPAPAPAPLSEAPPPQPGRQGSGVGPGGDHRLFTAPVLQVDEFTRGPFSISNFSIVSPQYGPLGEVRRSGKLLSRRLELFDLQRQLVMTVDYKAGLPGSFIILNGAGGYVGRFVARRSLPLRWEVELDGRPLGTIEAANVRATSFSFVDVNRAPLATITRPKPLLTDVFSNIDNYVMTRHLTPGWPIDWLTLIAPVVIDHTLLIQN